MPQFESFITLMDVKTTGGFDFGEEIEDLVTLGLVNV